MTFDQLIAQQRPHLERVIQGLARRHFLALTEVTEFRQVVDRALERNEYELLRAFDGRSTWETYLTTVVTRQFYLFQVALWGQWRPSAAAQRLGPAGMLLEELVVRDRFSLNDAIDWMRATHRVDFSRHRFHELAQQLGLGPAAKPDAASVAVPGPQITAALRDALALLAPDERLILELRFRDRQPLTRIAALLKIDARPLQRRIETALTVIRQSLVTQGIPADDVERLLKSAEAERSPSHHKWWQSVLARPSKESNQR